VNHLLHSPLLDDGEIVECNTPQAIFLSPKHPFTKRLIAALPSIPKATADAQRATALAGSRTAN